jgi:hypothetical protein
MSLAAPPKIEAPGIGWLVVREISRGGLAGLLTGIVFAGIGGRAAMRLASLIDRSAHGRTTEAGFTVGEFTLAGTIELVVFVGIFGGLFIAVVWVIVQQWLPTGRARYAAGALVGAAMGGRMAVNGRNFDFVILDPGIGQATIFVVLAALAGTSVVAVDSWLEERLPAPRRGALAGYVLVAASGLVIAAAIPFAFFNTTDCGCVSPPRLPGALLIGVGLVTVATWVLRIRQRRWPSWVGRAASVGVVAMVTAGLLHLGGEIAHFV